jgi:hypothetical protein
LTKQISNPVGSLEQITIGHPIFARLDRDPRSPAFDDMTIHHHASDVEDFRELNQGGWNPAQVP